MRRILLFLISAISIALMSSCSKTGNSLVGTTWASDTNGQDEILELCFFSESDVELSAIIDGRITETLYGTYTYNPPYIFFKFPNPEAITATLEASGEIKGNKIEWDGGIIFTRK